MLAGAGATDEALASIRRYADGIGPWKRLVVPVDRASGRTLPATALVREAHAAGLFVHVWTLRDEPRYLAPDYGGDARNEFRQFYALGVDGVFTDFPDTALSVRREMGNR